MCIWCGLHQVDLIAQQEYEALSNNTFVLMLTSLIAYLHCQQKLQMEMKTTCPKFVRTQRLSMKHITPWFIPRNCWVRVPTLKQALWRAAHCAKVVSTTCSCLLVALHPCFPPPQVWGQTSPSLELKN